MKVTTYTEAEPVASSVLLRVVMCVDVVLALWFTAYWWDEQSQGVHPMLLALLAVFGALVVLTSIGCLGLRAAAMVWRRRLGLIAVIIVIWRGGAHSPIFFQCVVLFWNAFIWIVLLLEARRVAHIVSEATGEEVLQADPERPDR